LLHLKLQLSSDRAFPIGSLPAVPNAATVIQSSYVTHRQKSLKAIASWPEADQQEIAEVAREIESRRTGVYRLSDAERAAVREGIDAADVGHFAPEDEIEEYYCLHRGV
jgi:hypothetical protein